MFLGMGARRLHKRRVQFADGEVATVSLFPFFTREGSIEQVLGADWDTGALWTTTAHADLLRTRWWGPHELFKTRSGLRDVGDGDALAHLWHFDPWWVLRQDRFASHPAVPVLKATNCVPALGGRRAHLTYRRDLTRLAWAFHKSGNSQVWSRWSADLLPSESPARVAQRHRSASAAVWTLDPPWAALTRRAGAPE